MTHKIAIITTRDIYSNYGDDHDTIIDSITDWTEVSETEFKTLMYAAPRLKFSVIEQPTDTGAFIAKTIADYLAISKAEEKREAEAQKKREEAALARKYKKELKDKESKLRMLKKLQEELGSEALK